MAREVLGRHEAASIIVPDTSTPTPAPDADTDLFGTGNFETATTFVAYTGTVSSGKLRLWVNDGEGWFKGAAWNLNSSDGNTSVDWDIGQNRTFTLQVESIAGGGSVKVTVAG